MGEAKDSIDTPVAAGESGMTGEAHFTKEEDEELGGTGLSTDGPAEGGHLSQGWDGLQDAVCASRWPEDFATKLTCFPNFL